MRIAPGVSAALAGLFLFLWRRTVVALPVARRPEFVRPPAFKWGVPALSRFLEVMEQLGDEKAFVHCRSGNRVGAVMLCKRVLRDGVPAEQAEAEARRIGLSTDRLWQFVREYLANHKTRNP